MGVKKYFVKKMLKKWEKQDNERLSNQVLPTGIKEIIDIPYIMDGHRGHLLDVYYPDNAKEKLPIIIDFHAGGLVYGDKAMNKAYGYHLAKRGFIVFNVNYRLALDDTKVPGQIKDVVAAIKWVSQHSDEYPADKEKVYIMGESGGAFLAAMGTLTAKSERLQKLFGTKNPNTDIKAVALVSGLLNLETNNIGYWGLRSMCLEKGYKKQAYYQNVIFDNIPEIKDFPPTFLTTSDEDELMFMTMNFERTLEKHNIPYRMKYFKKQDGKKFEHIFSVFDPDRIESTELINEMLNFFKSKSLT